MLVRVSTVFAGFILLVISRSSCRGDDWPGEGPTAQSERGMVVTVSKPASEIGREILRSGGNAVDAAVAVGFALAVTWPEAGNIAGGGFMLVHPAGGQNPVFIDYREKAPAAATVDMFAGGVTSQYQLVGVPGTVRGLKLAHERFGRLSWKSVVTPSIRLAHNGIQVDAELARSLNGVLDACRDNRELQKTYGREQGKIAWAAGDHFEQLELSETLQTIADEGADGFYTGRLADLFVGEMQRGTGLITKVDLAEYRAVIREPIHGTFRGYDIFASAPPSSGGIALVQMLNLAERFDLRKEGRWSASTLHIMIESMRRAYCDRARYLGDPDFTKIPATLTSKEYALELVKTILPGEATPSSVPGADILTTDEAPHTTHFSIIDSDGMAVSNTYTLEQDFGSRIVVRGAGFLLNNEMGDFNPRPPITNSKGLIGTKANIVAPGKRMLSSMTPVIVSQNGKVVLVTGSPGGRTIINTMFCMLINVLEFDFPLRDAVDAPRLHHAWMPDSISMERRLLVEHPDDVATLKSMGHHLEAIPVVQGDAHSISVSRTSGIRTGVADQRRSGWASGE